MEIVKDFLNKRRLSSCWNESALRRRWRETTTGR